MYCDLSTRKRLRTARSVILEFMVGVKTHTRNLDYLGLMWEEDDILYSLGRNLWVWEQLMSDTKGENKAVSAASRQPEQVLLIVAWIYNWIHFDQQGGSPRLKLRHESTRSVTLTGIPFPPGTPRGQLLCGPHKVDRACDST